MTSIVKSILLGLTTLLLANHSLFAQTSLVKPELSVYAGYGFADRINMNGGYFRIQDSPIYGGALAIPLPGKGQGFQLELSYQRQDTKLSSYVDPYYGIPTNGYYWNMSLNYFQLNAIYNIVKEENQRAIPFVGIGAGALLADFKESSVSDEWKFALNLKAGVKIKINDLLGLRLQGQMYSPVQGGGVTVGVGTGGSSVGLGTYSYIYQFSVTGGLIFYLKGK